MTPRKMNDTDENDVIRDTPAASLDTEAVRRLAKSEATSVVSSHELKCSLREKVEAMEKTQQNHGEMLAEIRGGLKLSKWLVPMLSSLTASAAALLINHLLRR